jgi:metal-dependent amidase/aminoacylase/carboxypeptidase family protein
LSGRTSHASTPEAGISPANALSQIIPGLMALGPGGPLTEDFKLATVVHAKLGEPAFGVAPGNAEIWVTLRAMTDDGMASLLAAAEDLARRKAIESRLDVSFSHHDIFAACANDAEATEHLRTALDAEGLAHDNAMLPFRGSEDFGLFGSVSKSAMFFIGAGETHPMVHNPDYDFPDSLIEPGVRVFHRVLRNLLG